MLKTFQKVKLKNRVVNSARPKFIEKDCYIVEIGLKKVEKLFCKYKKGFIFASAKQFMRCET